MDGERWDVVVVGAGQAGLATARELAARGLRAVVLEADDRVGDVWRRRWDSMRLFTPARFSALPGMAHPGPGHHFPDKDEMAVYLQDYARHVGLPVHTGTPARRVHRHEGALVVDTAGGNQLVTDAVVLATGGHPRAAVPAFAVDLDPAICQLHSLDYRRPEQVPPGDVLVVGAGNSGSDISLELAAEHTVWLAGRDVGQVPFRIEGGFARVVGVRVVLRVLFHRVMCERTPMGRRVRPHVLTHGGPRVRVKRRDLVAAGVRRVPRVVGVSDGRPELADGTVLDVAAVLWCTGFRPDWSFVDLPAFTSGTPVHTRGVVTAEPGAYLVGQPFQYALSSEMVHGVARDAAYVAEHLAAERGRSPAGAVLGTR